MLKSFLCGLQSRLLRRFPSGFTPISKIWFGDISRLLKRLVPIAITAIAMSVPITVLRLHFFYQRIVVYTGKTQPIAESCDLFALNGNGINGLGIILQSFVGIYVAVIAVTLAPGTGDMVGLSHPTSPAKLVASRTRSWEFRSHASVIQCTAQTMFGIRILISRRRKQNFNASNACFVYSSAFVVRIFVHCIPREAPPSV